MLMSDEIKKIIFIIIIMKVDKISYNLYDTIEISSQTTVNNIVTI